MGRIVLFIVVLLTMAAGPVAAEIYKWTDAEGRMHFTTDLDVVPWNQRNQSEQGARDRDAAHPVQRHSGDNAEFPARRAPGRARGAQGKRTYTIKLPPGATSMRVMVELNDRVAAPFIIDTGASDVVIPRQVADQLGITVGPETPTMQYRTANGLVESPVISLDSVSLGGARVEDVPASISDSLTIGLLGLSYFNHFQYEIDGARGRVHLKPNGAAESGAMRAGRNQGQWLQSFRNLRSRIETVQTELERTPTSRSRKTRSLEAQRSALLDQLARLEGDADQAHVPFAWRE